MESVSEGMGFRSLYISLELRYEPMWISELENFGAAGCGGALAPWIFQSSFLFFAIGHRLDVTTALLQLVGDALNQLWVHGGTRIQRFGESNGILAIEDEYATQLGAFDKPTGESQCGLNLHNFTHCATQPFLQPFGLTFGLLKGLAFMPIWETQDLTVINHRRVHTPPPFVGLGPSLGLNSNDATGADDNMINIEVLRREVVEDAATEKHQVVEFLADGEFGV
ncbi:MAG: hypothetical protein A2091_11590 [Desulfuromonadales bacterium GWD2_61_12]|nr:MAG: hypothetical protein A2091_11590 [Desulfuromonadales bacterium GWD2_61_12]